MTLRKIIGGMLGAALFVAGCSSGQEGGLSVLSRSVPDEFAVVKRKPLTLPPDFALRPPAETDRASQVALIDPSEQAKDALLGSDRVKEPDAPLDSDDLALLQKAGADKADKNIRRIVDQESTQLFHASKNFAREMLSFLFDEEPAGKVVEPEDAERAVRQRILVSSTPDGEKKATITRGKDHEDFDWDSLWPF